MVEFMFKWLFKKSPEEIEAEELLDSFDEEYEDELSDFLTSSQWKPADYDVDGVKRGLSHINFKTPSLFIADDICEVMAKADYNGHYTLVAGYDFDRCVYEVKLKDESDGTYISKEPCKNRIEFEKEIKKAIEQAYELL